MRVNHNMSAVVANNKLLQNEDVVASSMERLSSGLRINHAKDDPAGMAISNRMDTQIDGIDQASRNAQDATSLLETADGALNEVTSIIQRMNELSVQAANGTYTESDREAIQSEIAELKEEIDRMARDTEFNTKTLLDGSLDRRVYCTTKIAGTDAYTGLDVDPVTRISITDYVAAGDYSMTITAGTQSVYSTNESALVTGASTATVTAEQEGTITINGYKIAVEEGDTYAAVLQKLQSGAEKAETSMDIGADSLTFTSDAYGSAQQIKVQCSNEKLAALFGLDTTGGSLEDTGSAGTDAEVEIDETGSDFSHTTWSSDGNRITISQPDGFEMSFLADSSLSDSTVSLEVTTIGDLSIQIGANEGQTMDIRIPEVTTESLYIDDLDVSTINGANRALDSLKDALQTVTDIRAKLGAYENRLDYASSSLDASSENLTSALSRIEDVDMAEEMTQYTQYNVLVQASTSVLAQANDLPQQVLELLR